MFSKKGSYILLLLLVIALASVLVLRYMREHPAETHWVDEKV
jgi:hypothetical protein